ncbi:MAG: glycosyltransferase family 4 protein [Chloroflexi bacterium]|nr:glycosyltransferase family 4 protein [Chloroflexota bacterium]
MPLIGIDASRLAVGERTGTEQYTAHLLPALLAQPGDERFRLYLNRPPVHLPPIGARAEWRAMPWPRLWTHLRLAAEVRQHPPDLLFVPAHVLPFPCPAPAVVTIHDLGYLHFPAAHPVAARLYLDLTTRWSARAARRIIAISAATKRDLVARYRVPAAKVDVIHHGIAPRFRPPADLTAARAAVAALGIRSPYVLAVGTVQPRKNYPRLIAAVARLRAEGHDMGLVIAGRQGWLAAETLAAPAVFGIASHVHFTGYVPDEVMPSLIGAAEVVALPSLYEGLGMPAAEALACGAALVCSMTSALPEVAGDAAFVCDPLSVDSIAAALRQALTDAGARAEKQERGLARASSFTWERCAATTLGTLRAALTAGAAATGVGSMVR